MSSTSTDKNNPFWRCTNQHSHLETFSQPCCNKIFLNCLSHNSPAKGWPYRFRSRRTTGSSILDHDFGHLCRGRRIQMSGHSDLGIICEHLPFLLGYKQILRPLLGWWALFSEYCIGSRVVFHNVSSKHNSSFVLLELWLQLRILWMTQVQQWSKVNFSVVFLCLFYDLLLAFHFFYIPCWNCLKLFPFLLHCCLCIWNLHRLRHRNKFIH